MGLKTAKYYPDDLIRGLPDYLPGRGTDKRPNVGGVYEGTQGKKSVMLAAHTDTMPIGDPADWTVDPLGGEIKDGRIYGRGTGDNKFGIAGGIFLIRAFKELGIRLKQNVVLSAYCDEEYGGGNGSIASCVKYPCDMYINLDGGNSTRELWTAAVGGQVLRVEISAREPQDSASLIVDGLNVIRMHVEHFGARRRNELQRNRFYRDTDMQRSALRVLSFHCGEAGTQLSKGYIEFVFYTVSDKTEIKNELAELEASIRSVLDGMGIDCSGLIPRSRMFDYIEADENDPSIRLLLNCASESEGHAIRPAGACLSDYFLYYNYGAKCSVTYGVLRDFKLNGGAHQPDEFIFCEEFLNAAKALAMFLLRWCGYETPLSSASVK
jgi:acetylornithine deacetylase/succinyl-diaminopimelate desuccinylase-like protein